MKRNKNEAYEESQITTIYIFGFKLHFARKHNLKKSCLHLQILFRVCMDIWSTVIIHYVWIHKYKNYNVIDIYINRLGTTT